MDDEKRKEFIRMRLIATAMLLLLVCTLMGTYFTPQPPAYILLVRSMAEAGVVGGLADWFAVEALFRRPLGLPIPHTALLPTNQKRAAHNVGRFFDTYFMNPDQLRAQITSVKPALVLAKWLSDRVNAQFLTRQITDILKAFLDGNHRKSDIAVPDMLLRDIFISSMDAGNLSINIADLLKGSLRGEVLDELLFRLRSEIHGNRKKIEQLVRDRSRWWISSTVDRQIASILLDGILSVIDELSDDGSDLRKGFEQSIVKMIEDFQQDGVLSDYIARGTAQFVDTPAFDEITTKLVTSAQSQIETRLKEDPDGFAELLAEPVQAFSQRLLQEPQLRAAFDAKLAEGVERFLDQLRPAISGYVTDTIASWDSKVLIDRFELEVGGDLQFIRINGTVLGSFIGGVIFALDALIT